MGGAWRPDHVHDHIDAPTDKDIFQPCVRNLLIPSLRRGGIVVLDNLRFNKTPDVGAAIRSAEAEVQFLPPYSPDLNPLEKMWSKFKGCLGAIAVRTSSFLHQAIRKALRLITSSGSPRVDRLFLGRSRRFLEPF